MAKDSFFCFIFAFLSFPFVSLIIFATGRFGLVILGNAYMSQFFTVNQDPQLLKQCSSAYAQAVSVSAWEAV